MSNFRRPEVRLQRSNCLRTVGQTRNGSSAPAHLRASAYIPFLSALIFFLYDSHRHLDYEKNPTRIRKGYTRCTRILVYALTEGIQCFCWISKLMRRSRRALVAASTARGSIRGHPSADVRE